MSGATGRNYIVVSTDNHAGPSLVRHLRPHCPSTHLDDFDRFVRQAEANKNVVDDNVFNKFPGMGSQMAPGVPALASAAYARTKACPGQYDLGVREGDMDAEGVAAEVIFAGGQNDEILPFVGFGVDGGPLDVSTELVQVGCRIWNDWLADFVADSPDRHLGTMQIPIADIDAAAAEVRWGRERGLRLANLPAPRTGTKSYASPDYDPLWAVCEELDVPLATHSGGGDIPLGSDGPAGQALLLAEMHWLGRRGLWQLILGGVFERFPGLKLVFAEQRADWVPETLRHLDSVYFAPIRDDMRELLPKRPSEYYFSNCYNSGSFLSRFEVAQRYEIGLDNLMWASDYPHAEGTWPHSRLSMRNTFHDVPEHEVRAMLGGNAIRLFDLDEARLQAIADRIGPTVDEISTPLAADEAPAWKSYGYREVGTFA